MQITTLPVYSKLADPAEVAQESSLQERLPAGWQLSQHQLETYRTLLADDVDVVINTAMTGDGKSLAGMLPLLTRPAEAPTIALYPTNELIQDQYRSAERMLPEWGMLADRASMVFGSKLDELYASTDTLTRSETLLRELKNHRLVLSNPDMLHAILQFAYHQFNRDPTWIASQFAQMFQQLTFDEFHIFDTAQITAVLTGLLFLYEQSPYPLKTLLLSATPDERLLQPLQRAGFGDRLRVISPQQQGWYAHGTDPGPGWRPILQGCQITFVAQTAEEWVAEHLEDVLLAWFQTHGKGAKVALIVNSVATALRLAELLRPRFAAMGLTVEPNTGLNGRSTRKASYEADLLIGTSTVDVGVDFRINLLIFEAPSAGTFLQRLGRLGRHTKYIGRDGAEYAFHQFAAYALVPAFITERLFVPDNQHPAHLEPGAIVTREYLAGLINTVYPGSADFQHYARIWGRFQAAQVYRKLKEKSVAATYTPVRERLKQRYYALLRTSVVTAITEWLEYEQAGKGLLVKEAQSFRGRSPFDCGVLKDGEKEPLTYDLVWLLAHAHLELLNQEHFCAEVKKRGYDDRPYQRGYQVAFFRWYGLEETRRDVLVRLPPAVTNWGSEKHHTAQVLPGVMFDCTGHRFLNTLNDQLLNMPVVGLLIPGYHPKQLRGEVYLTGHFALHSYQDDDGLTGTIAFGRQALLLDSVLRYRKLRSAGDLPIFS